MRTTLVLALCLIVISCSKDSDKNQLLTTIPWTESKPVSETSKVTETLRFLGDGTFVSEAGTVRINGKWSWKNENEIYLEVKGLTAEGQPNQFDASSNFYIRILEISEKGLKTLERHEGDSWESGFAKERNFAPQTL